MSFPNQTGTTGSWQCPNCKQWVYNNWHACPAINTYPTQYYTYQPYIDPAVLERIAKALETIASQLTKRAIDEGESAAPQAESTPETLSTEEAES